jgi:hypothetical protein
MTSSSRSSAGPRLRGLHVADNAQLVPSVGGSRGARGKSVMPLRGRVQPCVWPVDAAPIARSFHLRWKQVPDPTHHSRKWAFSLLDTGFRHGPRGPTHESNHKADRFANVRVLATWTLFESEFCPNRFKRLGIRPIQSENFSIAALTNEVRGSDPKSPQRAPRGVVRSSARPVRLATLTFPRTSVISRTRQSRHPKARSGSESVPRAIGCTQTVIFSPTKR